MAALLATAGLLRVLSPSPLLPDTVARLLATSEGTADRFAPAFSTARPIEAGRWQRIYVRHSGTPSGDTTSIAEWAATRGIVGPTDHFVICNGSGGGDGEIQITSRWDDQLPAAPPVAEVGIEPGTISICLIGDFTRGGPTPTQAQGLAELVEALRGRLNITAPAIYLNEGPVAGTAAGIGPGVDISALLSEAGGRPLSP